MNNLIIDAAGEEIFLSLMINKNIYTCAHKNSKSNFEKLITLINNFLQKRNILVDDINKIYVNRGPGSFAGIRNSLAIVKGFYLSKNIDYYCFSYKDFKKIRAVNHVDIVTLCDKFKIKKNLIKPVYLS